MSKITSIHKTRKEVWRTRLGSALRSTLACAIVGCITLYGPGLVRRHIQFSSFSYLTTVLLVSDVNATVLGDTLRGCWHVFCATLQVMIASVLGLQVVGPTRFTAPLAAVVVAATAFVVALPESTHLMTKKIAFGQLVIVYVSTVIYGATASVVLHPIHVASSTALGALASVLAMLFPYPRLAYFQVRKVYQLYAESTCERLSLFLELINASDNANARDIFTKLKSLSTLAAKLLHSIKKNMGVLHWERPEMRIFYPNCFDLEEKLQEDEIIIRGMSIALSSCSSFPVVGISQELKCVLLDFTAQFCQKLEQAKSLDPFDLTTLSESKKETLNSFQGSLKNISIAHENLPTSFFLYCLQLLVEGSTIARSSECLVEKTQCSSRKIRHFFNHNLAFAFKCSVSLGLAVLFGLIYNKENGYWAGLIIAPSFVNGRQATFSIANARGQGTAMGSIYGIIGCFIFKNLVSLRLLLLLPWVIFSSFLMHSRMYGQAGGISAVVGALFILGRDNYGTPSEFALARITEATIGLVCFIIMEIVMNPCRAATLAKSELSQSLRALQDGIDAIVITPCEKQVPVSDSQVLWERRNKLISLVSQLEEFVAEAKSEPSFWFLPFNGDCYSKLLESLSRMADLLFFVTYSTEQISRMSQKDGQYWVNIQEHVNENIELFKSKVSCKLKLLHKVTQMKSLRKLEKELRNKNLPCDVETGELPTADTFGILSENEEINSIMGSFVQDLEKMADRIHTNKDEEGTLKGQMLLNWSCLGFCITGLMRETIEIENAVKELLIWENPSSHANLIKFMV
ncbi:hypothetical protein L6164_033535 [Bauhinia variegata]|uniref:Uncharacterized protein n=1 Tax=Bauhinia variegata TaxID=167791 RepID=A0ACB9KSD9_BAUVA|nr:hypothetical protein L6164_033535 [Bauhinia variegata]